MSAEDLERSILSYLESQECVPVGTLYQHADNDLFAGGGGNVRLEKE